MSMTIEEKKEWIESLEVKQRYDEWELYRIGFKGARINEATFRRKEVVDLLISMAKRGQEADSYVIAFEEKQGKYNMDLETKVKELEAKLKKVWKALDRSERYVIPRAQAISEALKLTRVEI